MNYHCEKKFTKHYNKKITFGGFYTICSECIFQTKGKLGFEQSKVEFKGLFLLCLILMFQSKG